MSIFFSLNVHCPNLFFFQVRFIIVIFYLSLFRGCDCVLKVIHKMFLMYMYIVTCLLVCLRVMCVCVCVCFYTYIANCKKIFFYRKCSLQCM